MKRKKMVKKMVREHPEIASKLKKLKEKKTPRESNIESQIEGLHETIFSLVVPESNANEPRKSEIYNSVSSLDDINKALDKRL